MQTRSFCFVDDLVAGLIGLMESKFLGPMNIGNPNEYKIIEIANIIKNKINPSLEIVNKELPQDDPRKRKPSIKLAMEKINWSPKIELDEGIDRTVKYFKSVLR